MKPDNNSTSLYHAADTEKNISLLRITRSKAKMIEFAVPERYWESTDRKPQNLFPLTIGILGDYARYVCNIASDQRKIEMVGIDFTASFFDAINQAEIISDNITSYIRILNAAAYYLGDKPGSASVLASKVNENDLSPANYDLEKIILSVLMSNDITDYDSSGDKISESLSILIKRYEYYRNNGEEIEILKASIKDFRNLIYQYGTPRQLLLADILCAVIIKKVENSIWYCFPNYTSLSQEQIMDYHQKENSIIELWPAQHLLGRDEVLKGKSSVVQMPTSAGKTKASEIILRNAFYGDNRKLAVIIAPFRSLCNEIRNNLQDSFKGEEIAVEVLEDETSISKPNKKTIVTATPEKFQHLIRSNQDNIIQEIDILILDEGHQFDDRTRGTLYELLITSLLYSLKQKNMQIILISAVIKNAKEISQWLLDKEAVSKYSFDLLPTETNLSLMKWDASKSLASLDFRKITSPTRIEFDVQGILMNIKLPKSYKGLVVAVHFAYKLVNKGAVAIFCGKKSEVNKVTEIINDIAENYSTSDKSSLFPDKEELERLKFQISSNFGQNSKYIKAIKNGFLLHHADVPEAIRVCGEYAIKKEKMKVIVCTSTLAQGVNMPIRYLLVSSFRQGKEPIKNRDFHNLVGRVGRSGKHTEGNIIFTDPELFEKKKLRSVIKLLDIERLEKCGSSLLNFFKPITILKNGSQIVLDSFDLLDIYLSSSDSLSIDQFIDHLMENKAVKITEEDISDYEISNKIKIIQEIESFLMSYWSEEEGFSAKLATSTLAYHLSNNENDSDSDKLVEFFRKIESNLRNKKDSANSFHYYGKSNYGLSKSIKMGQWITDNKDKLSSYANLADSADLIEVIYEILQDYVSHNIFSKITEKNKVIELIKMWCRGSSYSKLIEYADLNEIYYKYRQKNKKLGEQEINSLCEGAFSYQMAHFIGVFDDHLKSNNIELFSKAISDLQLRLKYGLPTTKQIVLFKMGFVDRELCKELSAEIDPYFDDHLFIKSALNQKQEQVEEIIKKYPSYFYERIWNSRIKDKSLIA